MINQPEALRLADTLADYTGCTLAQMDQAAAELRRLHTLLKAEQALHQRVTYPELRRLAKVEAQRDALLEALKRAEPLLIGPILLQARAAIAAVEEGK